MKKQIQTPISLKNTQILEEILRYVRFFALNKNRIEQRNNRSLEREINSIKRILRLCHEGLVCPSPKTSEEQK